MKNKIKNLLLKILKKEFGINDPFNLIEIQQVTAKNINADYFTNIAMKLTKELNKKPMEIAEILIKKLPISDLFTYKIAQPGYINFIIENSQKNHIVKEILVSKNLLSSYKTDKPKKINVEFVSANPTGPLHIGHGRGAVYGNIIAKFLKVQGHNVIKEYYVNDYGNQIKKLLISILAKIDNKYSKEEEDLYQGKYIGEIASEYKKNIQKNPLQTIENEKEIIVKKIIQMIKSPLDNLNIVFDNWFYETSLFENSPDLVKTLINKLEKSGHTIRKEGALMLKADEPRVLIKSDGNYTYFATDLAYHNLKMKEYDMVINIWGADHHGYVPRIKAGLEALGHNTNKLDIHLIQFANLHRGNKKISMSTRKGEFVELDALREEIGNDAMNFFYLTKNKDQHLDFDLNIAISENKNNPVYYIQYAHARIEKILNTIGSFKHKYDPHSLNHDLEKNIISILNEFHETCENTIMKLQPHLMTNYLQKLSQDFHSYYANVKLITEKIDFNKIHLIKSVQKVIKCGLELLNINAPKEM